MAGLFSNITMKGAYGTTNFTQVAIRMVSQIGVPGFRNPYETSIRLSKYGACIQCRYINIDRLSNKRITRLETDIELGDCSGFKGRLINRNPRNLEQMAFAAKPKGFWLDKSPPQNWNKLVLEQSGRHLNAYLQHWSGRRLVEASTRETKLQKYFKNPNTVQAATIIAQVITRRCLQSGYLCAGTDDHEDDDNVGLKSRVFFETAAANGLTLNESPEIHSRVVTDL